MPFLPWKIPPAGTKFKLIAAGIFYHQIHHQIDNPNVDLNTDIKDNQQEANETQGYNLADLSGRYPVENDYKTKMICKLLQDQLLLMWTINSQFLMSIFTELVEDRVDNPRGRLSETRAFIKPCLQQPRYLVYQNAKMLLEKRYGDPHRIYASNRKEIWNYQ